MKMKHINKTDVAPVSGQHTPGPWHVEKVKHEWEGQTYSAQRADYYAWSVFTDDMTCICETPKYAVSSNDCTDRKANAAFIVKACNCHDELRRVLRLLVDEIELRGDSDLYSIESAKAALNKASRE